MPVSLERDDRNPHPECFAGGGGPVVGERVEGDVDLVVDGEMRGGVLGPTQEGEAIRGDAVLGEELEVVLASVEVAEGAIFEEELGMRDGVEDLGPESDDILVNLGQGVAGAKGNEAIVEGWE